MRQHLIIIIAYFLLPLTSWAAAPKVPSIEKLLPPEHGGLCGLYVGGGELCACRDVTPCIQVHRVVTRVLHCVCVTPEYTD